MSGDKREIVDTSGWSLEQFAEHEGCEQGELWFGLLNLKNHSYAFSEEFAAALEKEIESETRRCREEAVVYVFTETRTHTYQGFELEF